MSWGFGCCCSPSPHGDTEKLRKSPSSRKSPGDPAAPAKEASSGENGGQAIGKRASGHQGPGGGPDSVGGSSTAFSTAAKTPNAAALERNGGTAGTATPEAAKSSPNGAAPTQSLNLADLETDRMSVVSHTSGKSTARSMGTSSSVCSEFINQNIPAKQRETSKIQQEMKKFVKSMVRGQQMGVIAPNGQLNSCNCSLDKKLKYFVIELKGSAKKIPLSTVGEVYQGKEPEDIDTPLDDLCSTIMLSSGECISFHFNTIPLREHFAMCLQILVDGQH